MSDSNTLDGSSHYDQFSEHSGPESSESSVLTDWDRDSDTPVPEEPTVNTVDMEGTQDSDKCAVCDKSSHDVACEGCEKVPYCSDACEAADFMSHREICEWKKNNLDQLKVCQGAYCDERFQKMDDLSKTAVCGACHGAKYCSRACMAKELAGGHRILCEAFVTLPPRPTINHKLYILFPALEDKPRFVWIETLLGTPNLEELKALLSYERFDICRTVAFDSWPFKAPESGKKSWREVATYYVEDWKTEPRVPFNRSLSKAATGRPMQTIKGNILVEAAEYNYDDYLERFKRGHAVGQEPMEAELPGQQWLDQPEDRAAGYSVSDVMPGDINRLLHYFNDQELSHPQSRTRLFERVHLQCCPDSWPQHTERESVQNSRRHQVMPRSCRRPVRDERKTSSF